jgi:glucokinase
MAMRFNARGGIYIGGGIAPNILHRGKQALFREAFLAKGRLSDWVSKVPVMLIRKPEPNLHGLAHYARKMMGLR